MIISRKKQIQKILSRDYDKRPEITYSEKKINYINVTKGARTIKKYLTALAREKLIETEENIENIDKIGINDFMIINIPEENYPKGFTPIANDLINENWIPVLHNKGVKESGIGVLGLSLLCQLMILADKKDYCYITLTMLKDIMDLDEHIRTVKEYIDLLEKFTFPVYSLKFLLSKAI